MWLTGWYYADPIASVLVTLFIFPRTWRLLRKAINILMEGSPDHIHIPELQQRLEQFERVKSVHDLHVWTIAPGIEALSAHVLLKANLDSRSAQNTLEQMQSLIRNDFGIDHVTLQLEHQSLQAQESGL
jgi:cobalt-zinc-cadmium efflux system protein